jgi:hypothetical protein
VELDGIPSRSGHSSSSLRASLRRLAAVI